MSENLFIVDNKNDERTVKRYLSEWCSISKQMDIATGYFEIGGLLELNENWQLLDKIRIILGSEVTKRTREIIDEVVFFFINKLNESIEQEKEKNEFLLGVPAILKAFKNKKIECRVFDKDKFHAKAYITHFKDEYYSQFISSMNVPKGYALVGSSNFTKAGLTKNIELNVQISNNVDALQNWFEEQWEQATDITDAILTTIEKHCKEYSPFDIYMRSIFELCKNQEQSISEWEENVSKVYPLLSQYQRDGYNSLINIAEKYSGSFLCDGVGLGKTFVGLMLIERFVKKERKNVVLIVPAAARIPVWETTIKKYIPEVLSGFSQFVIINHTDLLLEKNDDLMQSIANDGEIIIIDEAHHFRNRSSNRYRKLFEMMGSGYKKQMFMLTATPINNSFLDLQHLIELFSQRQEDYFKSAPLGIHSLSGHFRKMETALLKSTNSSLILDNSQESENIFKNDSLVTELVVQRSRAYVKKSLSIAESQNVLFPLRQPPIVANYSLKISYGKLIDDFIDSFYRKDIITGRITPILALPIYSPYENVYYKGDIDKIDEMKRGRQTQVVNLVRQLLLKRFESSTAAFEETCIRIFVRLRKFILDFQNDTNQREIDRFFQRRKRITDHIDTYISQNTSYTIEELEDDLPEYVWDVEENLNIEDFNIDVMLQDTLGDLEVLSDFIDDLMNIKPENDDKIKTLKNILSSDTRVKDKKVIIFTEYRSTAKYIYRELSSFGFKNIFELDGQSKVNRKEIIERFAPYYNDHTSKTITDEIQILIATDVLAEGLNLQDASCLINYELHWNPVRLMQRIGRVDRRRNHLIEESLLSDHPELIDDRQNVYYWNFLPPTELEQLLSLYSTVSQKTLRISKTFGVEGKQLLTPDDDYDALKDFNSAYEGIESREEEIALEFQNLMVAYPQYEEEAKKLPRKMFSGKLYADIKGIFFCYELPIKKADDTWSCGDGRYVWYLLNLDNESVITDVYKIWKIVKTEPEVPRVVTVSSDQFSEYKRKIESHINRTYMRSIQAPVGIKPRLVTWMQLV